VVGQSVKRSLVKVPQKVVQALLM